MTSLSTSQYDHAGGKLPLSHFPPRSVLFSACPSMAYRKRGYRGALILQISSIEYPGAVRIKVHAENFPRARPCLHRYSGMLGRARPVIGLPGTSSQPGQPCDASGFPDAFPWGRCSFIPPPKYDFWLSRCAHRSLHFLQWEAAASELRFRRPT